MRTFELGDLIAEQRLTFEADADWSREVWIRLGRPVADPSDDGRSWLCPYQIAGFDHDRVMAAPEWTRCRLSFVPCTRFRRGFLR